MRLPDLTAPLAFLGAWLRAPLATASVTPSSEQLARLMMRELPYQARRVIELGGGTGVFTQALLARGVAPDDLLVLELNEDLHQHLQRRFPDLRVVCGDARALQEIAHDSGFAAGGKADAVVSGLGLLTMDATLQRAIVGAAFACLAPGGRMVQFTYGPVDPVRAEVRAALGLRARRASHTWWNVPPATVWVYERA
jgi:phospholipid N-methyltransferase